MKRSLTALLLLLIHSCPKAAQVEVTSAADAGPGSLRAAIAAVNGSDPGESHDILFRLPEGQGRIELITPLPELRKPFVRMLGQPAQSPGAWPSIRGVSNSPVLKLGWSFEEAELRDLTFVGALDGGGCLDATSLQATATLLIDHVRFEGCSRKPSSVWDDTPMAGAALHASGQVSVLRSTFLDGELRGLTSTRSLYGGFIALEDGSLYIEDSHFRNAVVVSETDASACMGGAVSVQAGELVIIGSTFRNASAFCGGLSYGGAVASLGRHVTLRDSVIQDSSSTSGGGLWHAPTTDAAVTIENSTFVGNSAERATLDQPDATGGGVYLKPLSPASNFSSFIRSTTFSRNRSDAGTGAHVHTQLVLWRQFHSNLLGGTGPDANGHPALACTDITPRVPALNDSYSLATDASCDFPGTHQVPVNDLGVTHRTDSTSGMTAVRLLRGSPAIDAGSPSVPTWADPGSCPPADAQGVVRPLDGDVDGLPRCDIGALEYQEFAVFMDGFEA